MVSKRFYRLTNDPKIWRSLYEQVFEYSVPLHHTANLRFDFREPARWREGNPWKESFMQLYHGVHVWPGEGARFTGQSGRRIAHFESIDGAVKFVEARPDEEKLIFLHSGHYRLEAPINITSSIQIIGCSECLRFLKLYCGVHFHMAGGIDCDVS